MKNQAAVLTAAGLVVATAFAGAALALSSTATDQQQTGDTVPVGQLVDVPVSSTLSSSVEPPAVDTGPVQKDTAVPNQAEPQPAQQPAPADNPTTAPPATTTPTGENGAPLNPPPPPPAPPGSNPNDVPNPPALDPTPTP